MRAPVVHGRLWTSCEPCGRGDGGEVALGLLPSLVELRRLAALSGSVAHACAGCGAEVVVEAVEVLADGPWIDPLEVTADARVLLDGQVLALDDELPWLAVELAAA
jgi:hypothetical protein